MLLYNNHNYNTHTIQESAFAISLFSYKLMRPFHHGFLQKFQIYEHLFLLPIGLFLCPGYLGVLKAPGFYVLSFLYWISLWQSKIFQMLSVQIYMLRTSNASHITSCFFLVCQFCSPDFSLGVLIISGLRTRAFCGNKRPGRRANVRSSERWDTKSGFEDFHVTGRCVVSGVYLSTSK